jgi:hypothetical protein
VPAPASRVEITGNEIGVTSAPVATGTPAGGGGVTNGNGIVCGVSAARISDNDIVSQGTASADGILLDAPLLSMPLDGCQILGNRITGVGGVGIDIRTPLASAMIKQNTIRGTGAGGIVMTGPATAQHLSIANNQLLGLVPTVGQQQAALGVRLTFIAAAEIESNIIRDLGLDAASTVSRTAISLIGCTASRIAGNQISNIGPVAPTFAPAAPSAAIAVTGPTFDRAEVSGNVIRRSDPIGLSIGNFTLWRAVYVGPQIAVAGAATHSVAQTSAGQFVVIAENVLVPINLGPQLAAVRGNVMEGGSAGPFSPVGSFVELEVVGSGVFTDNQGTLLTAPNTSPPPLATLTAPMIAAANNILSGGAPSLQIKGPPDVKVTALGNITVNAGSDPILVNGQPLAAPWAPLNVHT